MSTVLERQRAAKLTDAQFCGLDLLVTRGAAMRARAGWTFGTSSGPFILPATMDALIERGLVNRQHTGADATRLGRDTHKFIKGGRP
ncbi:hypothetical protein [Ancylobacter pratisalsi]|uniref:Uncharacterized protein n=1 Tax=Ancylobacter pratisalsi TaxID=1745854 RepID=A0A6P1YNR1_9HYPH|nr:hypothetical protein [Ancylobacter pratisalsi]QIB34775.1 hypothetical protein G3A50_14450 [Ancylobacter pratisalsi]